MTAITVSLFFPSGAFMLVCSVVLEYTNSHNNNNNKPTGLRQSEDYAERMSGSLYHTPGSGPA